MGTTTTPASEPNHSKLDCISGQQWSDCEIVGRISDENGLKTFEWRNSTDRNAAKLLRSANLPQHLAMLDAFEGKQYLRTFVTADVTGSFVVAMVYQKRTK